MTITTLKRTAENIAEEIIQTALTQPSHMYLRVNLDSTIELTERQFCGLIDDSRNKLRAFGVFKFIQCGMGLFKTEQELKDLIKRKL